MGRRFREIPNKKIYHEPEPGSGDTLGNVIFVTTVTATSNGCQRGMSIEVAYDCEDTIFDIKTKIYKTLMEKGREGTPPHQQLLFIAGPDGEPYCLEDKIIVGNLKAFDIRAEFTIRQLLKTIPKHEEHEVKCKFLLKYRYGLCALIFITAIVTLIFCIINKDGDAQPDRDVPPVAEPPLHKPDRDVEAQENQPADE